MSYQFAETGSSLGFIGARRGWGRGSFFGSFHLGPGEPLLDARSEKKIATLQPWVQPIARKFIAALRSSGIDARVLSGTRSYDEQNALYAQGRTKPGMRVTNARGGYSNHNFGIAFDIGIFAQGKYLPESPLYKQAGAIGKSLGLSWGGDWKTFQDQPHYELRPAWAANLSESAMLTEFRRRVAGGEQIA